MEIRQLEAELEDAKEKIEKIKHSLENLSKWKNDLESALNVLKIIEERTGTDHGRYYTPEATETAVSNIRTVSVPVREIRPAKGKTREAGQALLKEIRARDTYMKPMEAVRWLQEMHGLTIGLGKAGRETSDLSAALGHGKIEGLTVNRAVGWGLAEWENRPRSPANRPHVSVNEHTVSENVDVKYDVSEEAVTKQESDEVERQY